MEGKFYAVIDTNVIVSAVISKNLESNPAKIIVPSYRTGLFPCSTMRFWTSIVKFCQGLSST